MTREAEHTQTHHGQFHSSICTQQMKDITRTCMPVVSIIAQTRNHTRPVTAVTDPSHMVASTALKYD